ALRSVIEFGCFNRFIYRREWVFAFIVKRFRVFRAPLQAVSANHGPRTLVLRALPSAMSATKPF
ncbi:hypothetical protein ABLO04_15805, partial [Mycobacterium tuberculosis]